MVELNGAKADDLTGAELGVGYNWTKNKFRLTPIVGGLIYQDDDSRYRTETLNNGNTICRDRQTGYFADKDRCSPEIKPYGKLEGAYQVTSKLEFGAGVRVSDEVAPYGLIGARLTDRVTIKGFGGKDYYGLGLTASF
ncbi:hypothetical protein DMC25_08350 [Caulobacter sp. D4A]|nr:hypothetical protein DMC25_08350 [Caulobacter sp. D4A]PXA92766.1 hypothetical protein DMC18_10200 [Caulobacter sp. D5]